MVCNFSCDYFVLEFLTNILNRNVGRGIVVGSKPLIYIIVGILLIVNGITSIPTQVVALRLYLNNITLISQQNDVRLVIGIYTYIVPIIICVIQIGVGVYFTLITSKINKQTGKA